MEALSRGAKKVTFVEKNKEYLERIIKIIKEKEEENNVNFFCDECLSWMKNYNFPEKFDLVFVDPPFKKNLIHQLLEDIIDKEILSESGRIYFEFEKELDLKIPKPLNLLKIKIWVEKVMFWQKLFALLHRIEELAISFVFTQLVN